jgi:predicted glycogen debranching enzyme
VISLDEDVCRDPELSLQREWLETNGIGGFASASVAGANTRRYHGLLTAALHPPVGRYVLLSKLEETVFLNGERYELSCNLYPGTTHPQGYKFLKKFRLDPFPTFTYEVGGVEIDKRVFMVQGENTTVVEYEVRENATCVLELRPLIAFRDYHAVTRANDALNKKFTQTQGEIRLSPYDGLPPLYLAHNARSIAPESGWYYNFQYPRERERGLDFQEDLFQPLTMQFDLGPGAKAMVVASTQSHPLLDIRAPDIRALDTSRPSRPPGNPLVAAANQFIVTRSGNLHTAIAGYHWFADWGRDTMIALPGLTLATGRFDIARDILRAFSRASDRGMLPNRFPDAGEKPEYNTVDASLWYFEAIRKFLEYTGDLTFVRGELYDTMTGILDWHIAGTRYGIHCEPDGLIAAGTPQTQLTWMDAKAGDFVATPRNGKPVEIQALWYNALRFTASLAEQFNDPAHGQRLVEIADRTAQNFIPQFWNEQAGCLYDVVDGERKDASIRPNQAIALSLGFTMVPAEKAKAILSVVERDLLTPYGLRTLSPSDPRYCARYEGDQVRRDSAYHQGTVWPWLLGPFITAYVKIFGPGSREKARGWLSHFENHLSEAGLGSVSEIFDGDAPHTPRGCIAQAWSVAELLRVGREDLGAGS